MPTTAVFSQTTWAFLEKGVERIMEKMHTGMEYSYYMMLYTTCYNYCVVTKGPGEMVASKAQGEL